MNYSPTFITGILFIGIYTAQIYTDINNTNKTRNLLYFIALTLFMAIINLLFGDRIAGIALGIGVLAWIVSVLLTPSEEPTPPPRCSSSAPAAPTCFTPTYECQQCDGTSDTIDCIDLHL